MMSEAEKKRRITRKMIYVAAFFIPCVLICLTMLIRHIYPFGGTSVLIGNTELQHVDFYSYLWDVLHGNASIEYSMYKSLGGRMAGLLSFYASGILNFGLLFISKEQIPEFLSWMMILKISLCGLTAYTYVHKRFELGGILALCISTSYAMMEYNVGYCRNLMWLDGVIMLPLVCLGIYRVLQKRSGILLWASVAIAILSNWYTGYMVCLMGIFYAVFELLVLQKEYKKVLTRLGACAGYLILGVMTSGAILVPAIFSMKEGKLNLGGIFTLARNTGLFHVLSGYAIDAPLNVTDTPVLFCGSFLLIIVLYGLIEKKISRRRKAGYVCLLLVMYLSCYFKGLEQIWSALVKYPTDHYRFAFVVTFALVVIAADIISDFKREAGAVSWPRIIAAILIGETIVYLGSEATEVHDVICVALVAAYLILFLCFYQEKKWRRRIQFGGLLLVLLCAELTLNAVMLFKDYDREEASYTEYYQQMSAVLDELKENDTSFYRLEKNYSYQNISRGSSKTASDEALLFGYGSIETYGNAYDGAVDNFLANVGYCNYPTMHKFRSETYWNSSLTAMDSLLGIKYVLDDQEPYGYTEKQMAADIPTGYTVYENNNALTLGTLVDSELKDFSYTENPFANQSALYSELLGRTVELYTEEPVTLTEQIPMTEKTEDTEEKSGKEFWQIKVTKSGPIYLFVDGEDIHTDLNKNNCYIRINGGDAQDICVRFQIHTMYLGEYKEGDVIEAEIIRKTAEEGTHTLYAAVLNTEVYESAITELKENSIADIEVDQNKVDFQVDTAEAKTVFLTIPYDAGWAVQVDGEEVAYKKAADTFIGIPVEEGNHKITMQYTAPGKKIGQIISLVGIVGIAFAVLIKKGRRRRKKE